MNEKHVTLDFTRQELVFISWAICFAIMKSKHPANKRAVAALEKMEARISDMISYIDNLCLSTD